MPSGEFRRELSLESQRLGRRERGQERRPRGEGGPGAGRDSPAEQARQGHRGRRNSRSKGPGVGTRWAGCVPQTGRKPVQPEERGRWEVYSGRARRGPRGPLTPTSCQGRVTRAATPGPAPSESLGAEPWRGYVRDSPGDTNVRLGWGEENGHCYPMGMKRQLCKMMKF